MSQTRTHKLEGKKRRIRLVSLEMWHVTNEGSLSGGEEERGVVMCLAWPQARSQARPGPKKPGQAGPKPSSGHKFWPGFGFPKAQAKPRPGPKAKALRLDRSGYQSACQPRVLDISYRLRVPHSLSPPS